MTPGRQERRRREHRADELRRMLEAAVGRHQAGALAEAEALYRKVLDLDPAQADAAHLLGLLELQDGKPDEAIALLDRAVARSPGVPDFHSSRAMTLAALDRRDEALAAYDTAIALDPKNGDLHYNRGLALHGLGRLSDAVAAFDEALAVAPGSAAALNNRGLAQQDLGLIEEALGSFDDALSLLPDSPEIHNNRGLALHETGRLSEAVAAFEQALGPRPDFAAARHNLGEALSEQGDLGAALAAYDDVLRRAPDFAEAHGAKGVALLKQGRPTQALAAFDRCLEILPGEVRSLAFKAIALREAGQAEAAEALVDLARFPAPMPLNPPERHGDPAEFLERLGDLVATHPTLTWEPHGKTTRAGSQTARLVEADAEVFVDFVAALRAAIDAFLARLPVRTNHPHFFRIPTDYKLSIWATVLAEGGHQLPHIHPSGWLSGVYYVAVPDSISDGDPDQAGWFEIGRPGDDLALTECLAARAIRPKAGALMLFPSYYFHRTLPFRGDQARISIAFDVEPLAFRS